MTSKLYHLFIKGDDELSVILQNDEREYSDAEFKDLVVSIMQQLMERHGGVGVGDLFDTLVDYRFVEPPRVDLDWAEALAQVKD